MAVILTDMQMPPGCQWCSFSMMWDNGHIYCTRFPNEEPVEYGSCRPAYCPLKAVETPQLSNFTNDDKDASP